MNYPKSKSFNEGLRAVPHKKFREVKTRLMAALRITSEPAWRRMVRHAGAEPTEEVSMETAVGAELKGAWGTWANELAVGNCEAVDAAVRANGTSTDGWARKQAADAAEVVETAGAERDRMEYHALESVGMESEAPEIAGSNGGLCAGPEDEAGPDGRGWSNQSAGPERWVTLPREVYGEACRRLCDAIDGENYFNGEVRFWVRNIECRLAASVIVYRRREELPEGVQEPISDLVPVWWEFHTERDGGEMLNDFSFAEMKRYL